MDVHKISIGDLVRDIAYGRNRVVKVVNTNIQEDLVQVDDPQFGKGWISATLVESIN